jgi:hypothetical protein
MNCFLPTILKKGKIKTKNFKQILNINIEFDVDVIGQKFTSKIFQIYTVHLDIIKVLFIHQLMH